MYAKISFPNKKQYLISPFAMNEKDVPGRAPVVGIALEHVGNELNSFVEAEVNELSRTLSYPSTAIQEYVVWSADRRRAVISLAGSCPAGCSFCYVPALTNNQSKSQETDIDGRILGAGLFHSVVNGQGFLEGKEGTRILLGGLTDPFHPRNINPLKAFLDEYRESGIGNILHIATRFPVPSDVNVRDSLREIRRLSISASVSSVGGDVAFEIENYSSRLSSLADFEIDDHSRSIYLRPLLPGVTLEHLDRILELASRNRISHIIVGNLYVDRGISNNVRKLGLKLDKPSYIEKRMIADRVGRLKKIDQENIRHEIFEKIGNRNFTAHQNVSDYLDTI